MTARPILELAVRGRQARVKRLVDEEAPHLLERDLPDEILDGTLVIRDGKIAEIKKGDSQLASAMNTPSL